MRTLLVLGGSGFIGKSILENFCSGKLTKYKITKLILVSRNISKLNKNKNKNVIFKSLDLTKVNKLPDADIIVHAAETSVKKTSLDAFKKSIKISSKVTNNLIKILKKINNQKNIIYFSSGAVYGSNNKIKKIKEASRLLKKNSKKNSFKNLYALNKIQSEQKILKIKNKHNVIILRLFSFVSKNIPENSNYILGNIKKSIKTNKTLILNSKNISSTYRSFLSTDDLINCIFKLLSKNLKNLNPIFNVGSDRSFSLLFLLNKVSKKFKLKYKLNKSQINKIDYYVPDITKLQSIIKYRINKNTFDLIRIYLSSKNPL